MAAANLPASAMKTPTGWRFKTRQFVPSELPAGASAVAASPAASAAAAPLAAVTQAIAPQTTVSASALTALDYLETEEPDYIKQVQSFDFTTLAEPDSYEEALLTLLDSPSLASKAWATDQYDSMVQTQTVHLPGSDAAVLRVRDPAVVRAARLGIVVI